MLTSDDYARIKAGPIHTYRVTKHLSLKLAATSGNQASGFIFSGKSTYRATGAAGYKSPTFILNILGML